MFLVMNIFDFVSEYSLQCSIAAASPAQSELYVYIVGAGAFSVFMKSRNAVAASLGQEKLFGMMTSGFPSIFKRHILQL